jgi:hypothetical protein
MNMASHGGIISTGENSRFAYQRSLSVLPAEPSSSEAGIYHGGRNA